MDVTISLPDQVFSNVANLASKTRRGVGQVIVEKLERDFSLNIDEVEKQISACSDKEIGEFSRLKIPKLQDERLSFLLQQQNAAILTKTEQKEMWKLMEISRLTTLKKAFALREISRRSLNGKN